MIFVYKGNSSRDETPLQSATIRKQSDDYFSL